MAYTTVYQGGGPKSPSYSMANMELVITPFVTGDFGPTLVGWNIHPTKKSNPPGASVRSPDEHQIIDELGFISRVFRRFFSVGCPEKIPPGEPGGNSTPAIENG